MWLARLGVIVMRAGHNIQRAPICDPNRIDFKESPSKTPEETGKEVADIHPRRDAQNRNSSGLASPVQKRPGIAVGVE